MSERIVWICDGCGKVSGAKKRVTLHRDWRDVLHEDAKDEPDPTEDDVIGREEFVCGVFVRHVATASDPLDPHRHDGRRGQLTGRRQEYGMVHAGPADDPEIPF